MHTYIHPSIHTSFLPAVTVFSNVQYVGCVRADMPEMEFLVSSAKLLIECAAIEAVFAEV